MVLDPAATASQEPGPKFKMISKSLGVSQDGDGRRRFHLTASSTIEDRVGDEIEVGALHEVAAKFREGVTIFMDHDWHHVESAFGVSDTAEVVQKGLDPESGKPIWDLDVGGVVNEPNPRAKQLADSIDGGFVRLGASMTAFIRKHARKPNGAKLIKSLDLVEASVVGVAENQRSWAHKAALAIKSFYKDGIDTSDLIEEETMSDEVIEKGMDAPQTPSEAAEPVDGKADDENEKVEDAPAPEATPATSPVTDESDTSDGQASASAGETPETASEDAPAEEPAADPPAMEKAYDPADVAELVKQTLRLVEENVRLNEVIVQKDLTISEQAATISRYEADTKAVTDEVDQAAEVIEKALALPLRPRAQAIVEETARGPLFASHPVISEYLSKRRHLSNG